MPEATLVTCTACRAEVPAQARFCLACGARIVSEDLPTFSSPARPPATPAASSGKVRSSGGALGEGRFLPGQLLAGRYRIVELLGRGGMGEVYRADDLTLGQPVALKFLPDTANDEQILARFHNEVRIARRVSHPNVCRVYDIGEAEGRHFLSMEYVDGEDLASLLRRIGRLPQDKALDVARRVCAGLAAAHAKGVLHRDLKPANVMLDGGGNILITDFGLAAVVGQIADGDVRSGTPAYMAPEQLENREVTIRSDVYALGLLLYEIFTGKRAYEGRTLAEIVRLREESTPSNPSDIVKDLDPAVERVILRCVERDPQQRPGSVLAVAAALPGGDPLAAALAAGETPSPQLVADAGESTGLSPRAALACLATVVVGLLVTVALLLRASGLDAMRPEPPEVLAQKARETIERLGYATPNADSASGIAFHRDLSRYLETKEKVRDWTPLLGSRLPLVIFWYRVSPQPMVVWEFDDNHMTPGVVSQTQPPTVLSGMINVRLDAHGRLLDFEAIPPEKETPPREAPAPDWDPLFAAAGLERRQLTPAEPEWASLAASDVRAAWIGTWPGTERALRVEAASFHGRPVFFSLTGPWTRATRMQPRDEPGGTVRQILNLLLSFTVLSGALFVARRNYVHGRGDRRGAFRLGAGVFCMEMAVWLCRTHVIASPAAFGVFLVAIGHSLFIACMFWLLYIALEPYVRRHWPQTIISWSRLLAGRFRDPLVGRDLIWGVILGLLWAVILEVSVVVAQRLGGSPNFGALEYLAGGRAIVGAWLGQVLNSVQTGLVFFFVLFLLRVLLREPRLAAVAFVVLFATMSLLGSPYPAVHIPTMIAVYTIAVVAVLRFGFITLAAGVWTANLVLSVPVTASLSHWYASSLVFVVLSILAVAAWGFYTALAGRTLWTGELFE
jgi:serine/threonine-protein kinase